MDDYRRGWALRYIREAKAELKAARRMPYMAPNLILEAVRKARNAIHYSLGEPAFIENIINETDESAELMDDPILRFLREIEQTIHEMTTLGLTDGDMAMRQADNLIQAAYEIVKTLTGEDIKDLD